MNVRNEHEMSARRADYIAWTAGNSERRTLPDGFEIGPSASIEELGDVLGALRKLKHDRNFIAKIFESRDKQLFPRDLLVATVPTRKGGRRPVGVIRRTLRFNQKKRTTDLSIDFVWVMPDYRSCGMGRQLMGAALVSGKPKDVYLQIAGSEANKAALGLYTSLGFVWEQHEETAKEKTEMILVAALAEAAVSKLAARCTATGVASLPAPPPPAYVAARLVAVRLIVEMGRRVVVRLTPITTPPTAAEPTGVATPDVGAPPSNSAQLWRCGDKIRLSAG